MTRLSDTTYAHLYTIPNSGGIVNVRLSNGTDLWQNKLEAIPTSGETFTIAALRPGDVNDDGEIQAFDAALTLQHSVGLDPLPEEDPLPWENWRDSTANVNGDAGITAYDAGLILQFSAGVITDFSGGKKKSSPHADIHMELEGDRIIFYSLGNLIGLNVSAEDDNKILGHPVVLLESSNSLNPTGFLLVTNIGDSSYRIGLCASSSPMEGDAVLEIPIKKSDGSITFHMLVNEEEKNVTMDLSTGRHKDVSSSLHIFPNPATDYIRVSGIKVEATARIYNMQGQELLIRLLQGGETLVDVSELPVGVYMIRLVMGEETLHTRFIKK